MSTISLSSRRQVSLWQVHGINGRRAHGNLQPISHGNLPPISHRSRKKNYMHRSDSDMQKHLFSPTCMRTCMCECLSRRRLSPLHCCRAPILSLWKVQATNSVLNHRLSIHLHPTVPNLQILFPAQMRHYLLLPVWAKGFRC